MATAPLLKTCKCAVCLQVLAFPVTWSCGHSSCKDCTAGIILEIQDDRGRIKCPECRKFANRASLMRFATNTVLQSLLQHLFPQELNTARLETAKRSFDKYKAQLKGPCAENGFAGENGGKHSRGWEVLKTESFVLHSAEVRASRNIIRDEADYAMHVCISPISSLQFFPSNKKNGLRNWCVRFCFLEMEEDEAEDAGFPISIHEHTNTAHQDMSLIRRSFEGTLECKISQDKKLLAELQADCIQGIAEFDLGRALGNKGLIPNSTVTIAVSDVDSGSQYKIEFKLSSFASQSKLSHLRRTISKRSNHEGEGESLDSEEDEEEDEDEDDRGSLDDFIVSDGTPTPQKNRSKRPRVHTISDEDEDKVSEAEIFREDDKMRQTVRFKSKVPKKVIELSDSEESELELAITKARASAKKNKKPMKSSSSEEDEEDSDDDEDDDEGIPRRQLRKPQLVNSEEEDDDSHSNSDDDGETLRRHIRKLRHATSDDDEQEDDEEEDMFENDNGDNDEEEADFRNEYVGRSYDSDEDEEEEL